MVPFTPNHRKMVNACYPKDLDPMSVAPEGNSLGKLAYYCTQKPHKLPKVSAYLISLARKEASQGGQSKAQGGLIVTLEIFRELVKEAPSQLSFFGAQVLEAVGIAFDAVAHTAGVTGKGGDADLEVLCKAASLWRAFTTFANGELVGTDAKVTREYNKILALLASMAKRGYADGKDKNHANGARYMAIGALEGSVMSEALYTSHFKEQVDVIVPALLHNIIPGHGTAKRLVSEATKSDHDLDLYSAHSVKRPLAVRRVRSIRHTLEDENPPSEEDIATHALHALRALFRISNSPQIEAALSPLVKFIDKTGLWSDKDWCAWLAETVVMWSHLQYRFVVFNTLLEQLTQACLDHRTGPQGPAADVDKPRALLTMITAIVKSKTTLVGLGVGHVLNDLLKLVEIRAQGGADDPLMPGLIDAVSALGTHIYYVDQIGDLSRDIISAAIAVQAGRGKDVGENSSEKSRDGALVAFGQCLEGILVSAHDGIGKITTAVPVTEAEKQEEEEKKKKKEKKDKGGDKDDDDDEEAKEEDKKKQAEERKEAAKQQQKDAVGRPMMKVQHAGIRGFVTPAIWQDSLQFLNESSYAVRVSFARALLIFLRDEVPTAEKVSQEKKEELKTFADGHVVPKLTEPDPELSRFFNALAGVAYQTATSKNLGSSGSRPSTRPSSTHLDSNSPVKKPKRKSSVPNSEGPGGGEEHVGQPLDYTLLREALVCAARHPSPENLLAQVPMLLALDRDAGTKWSGSSSIEGARRHASREVVAATIETLGKTWSLQPVVRAGNEATKYLSPSILPRLTEDFELPRQFGRGDEQKQSGSRSTVPVVDRITVIEAFSGSSAVQNATGWDKSTLRSHFGKEWSYDDAVAHASETRVISESNRRPSAASSTQPRITGVNGRARTRSFRSSTQPSVNDFNKSLGGSGDTGSQPSSPVENHHQDGGPAANGPPKVDLNLGSGSIKKSLNGGGSLGRAPSQRKKIASTDILASLRVAADQSGGKHASAGPPTIVSPPYDI